MTGKLPTNYRHVAPMGQGN